MGDSGETDPDGNVDVLAPFEGEPQDKDPGLHHLVNIDNRLRGRSCCAPDASEDKTLVAEEGGTAVE